MIDGLIKVAAALPRVEVADVAFNTQEIESLMVKAEGKGVEILCFPNWLSQPTPVKTSCSTNFVG